MGDSLTVGSLAGLKVYAVSLVRSVQGGGLGSLDLWHLFGRGRRPETEHKKQITPKKFLMNEAPVRRNVSTDILRDVP